MSCAPGTGAPRHRAATGRGRHRRRHRHHAVAHLRHHRALHAVGRAGDAGGAAAARRDRLCRDQHDRRAGGLGGDGAASGLIDAWHLQRRIRRPWPARRDIAAGALGQCRHLRRHIGSARSLRRAHRLDRGLRGRARGSTRLCACARRFCPCSRGELSISAPPTCARASRRFAVGVSFATM